MSRSYSLTSASIHSLAQVRRALGSPELQILTRSVARFLYCSRLGRGGSGSASDIRISFHGMPGVRTNQAERRFVAFSLSWVGGHGPFRGLDAPLAPSIILT